MRQQSDQILSLQASIKDARLAVAEAQSKELPMQYDNLRLQRENEAVANRLAALELEV